jgi:hypothetical protein
MNPTLLLIIGGVTLGLWLLWNALWIGVGLEMQRRQNREIEQIAAQTGRTPEQVRLNWSGKLLGETDAQYHQRVVEAGAVAREQMTDEEIAMVEGLGTAVLREVYGYTDDDLAAAENVKNWHTLTEEQRKAHFDRFVLPKLGEPEDAP